MSKKTKSYDELLQLIEGLSPQEMRMLNTHFVNAKKNTSTLDKRIEKMVLLDLQERVKELNINSVCPKCGCANIVKSGTRDNGVQRLLCKDCGHRFTYFTGTVLEKTKYHWDFWIEMIFQMLSFTSLDKIKTIMEEDLHCLGIHHETIYNWRQKIFEASKKVEPPQLEGVVEIDETFIHEGQKGSLHLIDPFDSKKKRKARKTGSSAKFGPMGPEFANIICAVDQKNHVVAKYVGVGACKEEVFAAEFHPYIKNATWICTDANVIYQRYAYNNGKNHYVRPSNYLNNLNNGFLNDMTEEQMYNAEMLDFIELNGKVNMTFKKFKSIKEQYGLGLGHVNAFHNELDANLVKKPHGISLVNIPGYVAWLTLLQNYSVEHGHKAASRKDAEQILIMLLKAKTNIKVSEISSKTPDFSNISTQYKNNIVRVTNKLRKKDGREHYVLTSEDVGPEFNKRKFLESLPLYMLKFLANKCKIPGRTTIKKGNTYKYIKALEVHPDLSDAIYELRAKYGTYDNI